MKIDGCNDPNQDRRHSQHQRRIARGLTYMIQHRDASSIVASQSASPRQNPGWMADLSERQQEQQTTSIPVQVMCTYQG